MFESSENYDDLGAPEDPKNLIPDYDDVPVVLLKGQLTLVHVQGIFDTIFPRPCVCRDFTFGGLLSRCAGSIRTTKHQSLALAVSRFNAKLNNAMARHMDITGLYNFLEITVIMVFTPS